MLRAGPISSSQYEIPDTQLLNGGQDPVNVQSILQFVRRSWKAWALWIISGFIIGLSVTIVLPSYYTAYATLLLDDRTIKPLPDNSPASDPGDSNYADGQVQVLQSREVIGRVVEDLHLLDDPEFGRNAPGLRSLVVDYVPFASLIMPKRAELSEETVQQLTIMRVYNALSVRRVGVSNAIDIGFTSRDPSRAAEIANAVAKAYIDTRSELKQKARDSAAAQLRERVAEAREKAFGMDLSSSDKALRSPETGDQARERFRELQSTTETYRALYNSFLQRYTEAVQQLSVPGARVITPAEPPLERSWPLAILFVAVATVGCGGLGFAHSLLKYSTDQTFHSAEDLYKVSDLNCLAEIPRIEKRTWRFIGRGMGDLQSSYLRQAPRFCEHIAKAVVYLVATRVNSKGVTIGVAPVDEGSGASSVAAHLARSFAQSGLRTLLIDANWKDETVRYSSAGSSSGRMQVQEKIVASDSAGDLDVLVIRGAKEATDLSGSQGITSAILRMQGEYTCIVVDFHGLDRSADMAASISLLDDVILVVEARRTKADRLRNALRVLPLEKISLVLNKVDVS